MTQPLCILVALMALLGCKPDPEDPACSTATDADEDGLSDCDEEALGTNPNQADSDDDGFSDAAEVDCVSDPTNPNEACYACGWEHNDPGDLESRGAAVGDVINNVSLVDQCGESVELWDFYGEYHILYLTAAW